VALTLNGTAARSSAASDISRRAIAAPDAYYAFAVVGLITLQVLNSTLHAPPGALRQEQVTGNFERFVLSPMGAVRGMLALMLFPFLFALVSAVMMLVLPVWCSACICSGRRSP
jgi:hypothetical protein